MQDPVRWLAFSCAHAPLQDEEAVQSLIETIVDYKPDLIIDLGDTHEADSASRWPSEYIWSLEEEYESTDNLRRQIRLAAALSKTPTKMVWLPGNHDRNLIAIARIDKKIRSLVHWKNWEQEFKF